MDIIRDRDRDDIDEDTDTDTDRGMRIEKGSSHSGLAAVVMETRKLPVCKLEARQACGAFSVCLKA